MGELSEIRIGAVRQLIAQVPDGTIRSLETLLASNGRGDRSIALVHDLISAEMLERRVRGLVFSPLAPQCEPQSDLVGRVTFPRRSLALAWAAVKATAPDLIDAVMRQAVRLRVEDEAPPAFDEVCLKVAAGLRDQDPAFAALDSLLGPARQAFAESMALAPVVRTTLPKLPVWVRTLSNEPAAAIRLAFRDATSVNEDAGPAFMELLYGHLEESWQVLRLISLVMDRPSDRYLASSELASFGERLLADIDARIEALRRFDPSRGLEGGVEMAASVHVATTLIGEFEQWLNINREGPWGSRLTTQKRNLALAAEARLREAEGAVNAALPVQAKRARAVRGLPNLGREVDPAAVRKAQAILAFVYETRGCASYGGFGAVRTKVLEALDPRIDQYAEDLLEVLHQGEGDAERIRAYLEIAAEFLGLVRDPKAAEFIRRRAAVA